LKRCQVDKIASVTLRLGLDRNLVLGDTIPAEAGTVIAARVKTSKSSYNTLEDVHGRMVALHAGDVIVGALGRRDALYGYSGHVPSKVSVGDELQLLNLGGVIGAGAEATAATGEPFKLEVLGAVLEFPYLATRVGIPANITRAALPTQPMPTRAEGLPPLIVLVGTCMDAGKTTAASILISELTHKGLRVAAGKLTGVSLRRDVLQMQDCGADPVAVFTDFGVVTTDEQSAPPAAHSLIAHVSQAEPDLIVLEMGDGLLGTYGVHGLLADAQIRGGIESVVLCAQDPVGAWGAQAILRDKYGLGVDVVSGRVTDSPVGRRFCSEKLGVSAFNALREGRAFANCVLQGLIAKGVVHEKLGAEGAGLLVP